MTFEYIDTPDALRNFCDQLKGSEWITLDTEFLRNDTYWPRLCLVQIANPEFVGVIDTIALEVDNTPQLAPLYELLNDKSMVKVLHAADQDFQIFTMLAGKPPSPIFDTQVAASVCGLSHQIGYGGLIEQLLGVTLDKGHSRTDWTRRPLSEEELDYAVADVTWLRDAYLKLKEKMAGHGREQWLAKEFASLENPARYIVEPQDAWKKVKGTGRMRPTEAGIVRELAEWRELRALEQNKPRNWIIKDELIRDLAKRKPKWIGDLKRMQGFGDRLLRNSGDDLLACVARGIETPSTQEETKRPKPLTPTQDGLADVLFAVMRMLSLEQDLSPETVGNKKSIIEMVRGNRDLPLLEGWRLQAVGQTLLDIIDGKISVDLSNNGLTLNLPSA